MRLALVIAAAFLLPLVPLPAASAQTVGTMHLLTDEKGDTVLESGVPGAPPTPFAVNGQTDGTDLIALDVTEQDDSFSLVLTVAGLKGQFGSNSLTTFDWRDVQYSVSTFYQSGQFGSFSQSVLYRADENGVERAGILNLTVDVEKATLTSIVPKVYLLDGQKRTPSLGDALTDVKVTAESTSFRFSITGERPASVHDAMPNSGDGAKLVFGHGDAQSGHVFLRTADRVRVSNGGATTFVFQADVINNGSTEDDIKLAVGELPEGWNATVQSPLKLGANQQKSLAILVSVPFAHAHGGYSSFNLTATSSRDPNSRASLRLGVLHTPIPQPAGHHGELYLHAMNLNSGLFSQVFPFTGAYFNTESTHTNEPEGVNPNNFNSGSGWRLPLNPSLQIGVDFDINRTGLLEGSINVRSQGTGSVSAKLLLMKASDKGGNGDSATVLAEGKGQKLTYDLQKPSPFKIVLVPTPESDYIPYAKGQNLLLIISMKDDGFPGSGFCCFGGQTGPVLNVKDFKMTLPLNEYNDQLTGFADVASALDIKADGPVVKTGRPGNVMTYAFDLVNGGSTPMEVKLDVAGNDAKAGTLVPRGTLSLPPHGTQRVTLGVSIPFESAEGQELEVLVFAHAQDDPSKMAIARTHTLVSKGASAGDDEAQVLQAAREKQNTTPGPGALIALAALGALAVGLRRKRRG